MTQAREPHDGLRGKFLRQFHAALVGRAVGIVEIDVGQLFCAAQRTAFDLFDLLKFRAGVVSIGRRRERRRAGELDRGSRAVRAGPGSNRCDQAIMSLRRRLSNSAAEPGSSIPSSVLRCILAVDLPFGAPGKPPLATQQITVG